MAQLAVVTGASRGIGRATALHLGELGFRLVVLGRASPAMIETLEVLSNRGAGASHYEVELTDADVVAATVESVLQREGVPDVIVHNAGIIERAPIRELSLASWSRQLSVNLTAPFLLTRAFLPRMLEERKGRVLFVSSVSAQLGSRDQAAYNVSKAGLVALMRCLAEELSDTGLMTAALLPGAVATDMVKDGPWPARMVPEEVAKTLGFLAREASLAHNGGVFEMFGV